MAPPSAHGTLGSRALCDIYQWLTTFNAGSPELWNTVNNARMNFQRLRAHFLPYEIDKAIDIALGAYCNARAGHAGWASRLGFDAVGLDIGYKTFVHSPRAAKNTYDAIEDWVKFIAGTYSEHELHRDGHPIDVWAMSMLPSDGITERKIQRIHDDKALVHEIEAIKDMMNDLIARGEELIPVHKLPSATSVFYAVFLANTPSQERLRVCRELLQRLEQLYGALGGGAAVEQVQRAIAQYNEPILELDVTRLTAMQQYDVVQQGRRALFDACQSLQLYHQLPPVANMRGPSLADQVVAHHRELVALAQGLPAHERQAELRALAQQFPLVHAELFPENERPGSPSSLRALGHARIAPRKAWRYYGTTAPEWEARW